jgi:DNA repair protein RadC
VSDALATISPEMPVLIAAVPSHERPRERLLTCGVEALTEGELLALVLRSGSKGRGALDVASELLAEYGSLKDLARAHPEELVSRPGVGPVKAAALIAAFRLGRKIETSTEIRVTLRTPADVAPVARRELKDVRRERVLVLVCDARNRLRRTILVSEGSVDRSLLPLREVLNAVLRNDGRAFALAHNHPSGDAEPSEADRRITDDIKTAANFTGLRFLGHIIVGGADWRVVR